MSMPDEQLDEIRRGVEGAQEEMRAYAPLAVSKAAHYNAVSAFDRICADLYVFKVVPELLAEVERLRAEHAALRALALDVAALPSHGMWTADVAPLIERARALLAGKE